VKVYDDFAHHPTAIASTLEGARAALNGEGRLMAVLEPRSNTMRMGIHRDSLAGSLQLADKVFLYTPAELAWSPAVVIEGLNGKAQHMQDIDNTVTAVVDEARPGDVIVVMSNGGFGGIHEKLLTALNKD
jgi:UDP-N-acetylmuramate: L-alanyl-gamma-D-glutamyl-meso-diaminopimelate ligase